MVCSSLRAAISIQWRKKIKSSYQQDWTF